MPKDDAKFSAIACTTILAAPSAPAKPARERAARGRVPSSQARSNRREHIFLAIVALVLVAAVLVARSDLFTAGSELGYWLGVAGGVAMLLLFLYPLRKRWRALRDFGSTRSWFAAHMVLGIAGPALIIVHSTLRLGSVNATFAFASMVVVALSGVVGRFLYTQIHHGLYGRRASLAELRAQAGLGSGIVHSKFAFTPDVERRLNEFARRAEETRHTGLVHPWRFFALGVHAAIAQWQCTAATTRALERRAEKERWSESQLRRRIAARRALIATHLQTIRRVAQFAAFERFFSIWHVLHVPLVYMLVLSAIAHVVAVHMY